MDKLFSMSGASFKLVLFLIFCLEKSEKDERDVYFQSVSILVFLPVPIPSLKQ